jgi:hypothetical protein
MVTAIRSLAAAVLFMCAAVGLAVPATAGPLQCNQFGVCR